MEKQLPPFVPAGTEALEHYARQRRMRFEREPHPTWYRRCEPFDTMVAPAHYLNAATMQIPPGSVTVVEPWTESGNIEPMDRTIMAFASHGSLGHKASIRVGEHFITRVSFLTDPPPPEVKVGDSHWDEHVKTFAASPREALAAFTGPLRALLQQWGFRGHLELRPGIAVVHIADLKPIPQHYGQLRRATTQIVTAALTAG